MIVKMKFLSITGPKNDIDRVTDLYFSKYEIQLENALSELKTVDNLQPFIEEAAKIAEVPPRALQISRLPAASASVCLAPELISG